MGTGLQKKTWPPDTLLPDEGVENRNWLRHPTPPTHGGGKAGPAIPQGHSRLAQAIRVATQHMAIRRAEGIKALAQLLFDHKVQIYEESLRHQVQEVGGDPSLVHLTNTQVLARLRVQARVSATSIYATRQKNRAALAQKDPTGLTIQKALQVLAQRGKAQTEVVSTFEAATEDQAAQRDFIQESGLVGYEMVVPEYTASDDMCRDAVDLGAQPMGTFEDFPAHPHCPHYVTPAYTNMNDYSTTDLWMGQDTDAELPEGEENPVSEDDFASIEGAADLTGDIGDEDPDTGYIPSDFEDMAAEIDQGDTAWATIPTTLGGVQKGVPASAGTKGWVTMHGAHVFIGGPDDSAGGGGAGPPAVVTPILTKEGRVAGQQITDQIGKIPTADLQKGSYIVRDALQQAQVPEAVLNSAGQSLGMAGAGNLQVTPGEIASTMWGQWVQQTTDPQGVAMNIMAQKTFGGDAFTKPDYTPQETWDAAQKIVSNPDYQQVASLALHAQYEATQQYFKDNGITSVALFRGGTIVPTGDMATAVTDNTRAGVTVTEGTSPIGMNPISSFSTDPSSADMFTHYWGDTRPGATPITYAAEVPASRILATPMTGFAHPSVNEVTVLAGGGEAAWHINTTVWRGNAPPTPWTGPTTGGKTVSFPSLIPRQEQGQEGRKGWVTMHGAHVFIGGPDDSAGGGGGSSAPSSPTQTSSGKAAAQTVLDTILKDREGPGQLAGRLAISSLRAAGVTQDQVNAAGHALGEKGPYVNAQQLGVDMHYAWAASTTDAQGLALNSVAYKTFGLEGGDTQPPYISDSVWAKSQAIVSNPDYYKVASTILQGQYDATQQYFKDNGITSIALSRGLSMVPTESMQGQGTTGTVTTDMSPVSSFTADNGKAPFFANLRAQQDTRDGAVPVVLTGEFPVSRVLSTPTTGLGIPNYGEVTVLRGPTELRYTTDVPPTKRGR